MRSLVMDLMELVSEFAHWSGRPYRGDGVRPAEWRSGAFGVAVLLRDLSLARLAGEERLAHLSCAFVTEHPAKDRREFLERVDHVILELGEVCERAGINEASRSLELVRLH